jgi:hypothetical protein
MKAINSNSLFFRRNSQLIKESQQASANANASANTSAPQSGQTTGTGANKGQKQPPSAPVATQGAAQASGSQAQPQAAQGGQPASQAKVDLYYENLLKTDNAIRTSLELVPFKSVREMLEARKRLKNEYEAAKAYYIKNNYMTEAQFKEVYPTVYEFEADQKRGAHNILERSFGDNAILSAIISNDEGILSKLDAKDISRVMSDFVKRLPSPSSSDDLGTYEYRLNLALAEYEFKFKEVRDYFFNVKMSQAKSKMARRSSSAASRLNDERVIQESRSLQQRTPIQVRRFDQ